jgi:hypothetical protein
MNLHLDSVEFQTDAQLQCSVLNWVHSHDKTFYTAGITQLQNGGKKCWSKGRISLKEVTVWQFWLVYSFCK